MKECVIKVQTQHHLDVIIGRVRSLGGKYEHCKYIDYTVYELYHGWLDMGLPIYVWLHNWSGLVAELHNQDCWCEVFHTVQDAIEYLGLDG